MSLHPRTYGVWQGQAEHEGVDSGRSGGGTEGGQKGGRQEGEYSPLLQVPVIQSHHATIRTLPMRRCSVLIPS